MPITPEHQASRRKPGRTPKLATPIAALLVLALLSVALSESSVWRYSAYKCRRQVRARTKRQPFPGEEVCVVTFPTAGYLKPDGSDVRVATRGDTVHHKVLSVGPGDFCTLAFEMVSGVSTYDVYYGNPSASAPTYNWEPERGLFLETRKYRGGSCGNWKQMKELVDKAGPVFGAGPVPSIFHGYNCFGPCDKYVSIYRGQLAIPAAGDYQFSTTSDEASFMFVDDRIVAQKPGWGGAHRDPRRYRGKPMFLKKGLHKVEYYHVENVGSQSAVAAWSPPDQKYYKVIPASAFPSVHRGTFVGFQMLRSAVSPDLEVSNAGLYYLGNTLLIRMTFKDRTPGDDALAYQPIWRFGDGTTSAARNPEHVYLSTGMYTVEFELRRGNRSVKIKQRLEVDMPWSRQTKPHYDKLESYYPILKGYQFDKMSSPHLMNAALIFDELGKYESLIPVCKVLLQRSRDIGERPIFDHCMFLGKAYKDHKKLYDDAVAVYRFGEITVSDVTLKAKLCQQIGDVFFYYLDKYDSALEHYTKILDRYAKATDNVVRLAQIRIGDVYRKQGDSSRAAEAYAQAQKMQIRKREYEIDVVKLGSFSHSVEDYIRRRELKEARKHLDVWEWEYPEEKLAGLSSILRGKLAVQEKNHAEAIKQFEDLVRGSPKCNYADEALMLAADSYLALGDKQKARETLERMQAAYPESSFQEDAKKKLEQLD